MKTVQLTNEQYEALMQGQSITIEPPKPEKWEPKGGNWFIDCGGYVSKQKHFEKFANFGTEYPTKNAAEKARDAMRTHNRLLAWVAENDDGWVADWSDGGQNTWGVYYSFEASNWITFAGSLSKVFGAVYMSRVNAEKLCKLLNDGVVEL